MYYMYCIVLQDLDLSYVQGNYIKVNLKSPTSSLSSSTTYSLTPASAVSTAYSFVISSSTVIFCVVDDSPVDVS